MLYSLYSVIIFPAKLMEKGEPAIRYEFLYRLLRPDENDVEQTDICAKNPESCVSVIQHVANGSYGGPSKFISTSASQSAIKEFASHETTHDLWIAVIDCDELQKSDSATFMDLTDQQK